MVQLNDHILNHMARALQYYQNITKRKRDLTITYILEEKVKIIYTYFLFSKKRRYSLSYEPKKGAADFVLTSPYDDKIVVEVGKGNKSSKQVLKSMERIGAPKKKKKNNN